MVLKNNVNKGLWEMFAATFIWGSIPLFSIWCSLPSPVFVFFRVLFAFPFVLVLYTKRFSFRHLLDIKPVFPLFVSGVVLSLNWIFFFWAINLTDISTAVVLYYFGPIFTIILAIIFLKEPLDKILIASIMIAFAGVLFVFAPAFTMKGSFFGIIVAFLSGLLYGVLGFVSKIAVSHHSSLKITIYQLFVSMFFTLPFIFIFHFDLNIRVIFLLIITGVVHTALALFLWYDSLNYIKVSTSAIFSYLDPLFAILLGYLFLDQIPRTSQIIGGFFIFLSGILVSLREK